MKNSVPRALHFDGVSPKLIYMSDRFVIVLQSIPDPVTQERLEDMGFFRDPADHVWSRFCTKSEVEVVGSWLKNHRLEHRVARAQGRGMRKKYPCLTDLLLRSDGGSPTSCALCGMTGVFCRKWVEGDDTDSIDYPAQLTFYMCGQCVQLRMSPHPRLYVPAEDAL